MIQFFILALVNHCDKFYAETQRVRAMIFNINGQRVTAEVIANI